MGMNCPRCGYDIYPKYQSVLGGGKSKFLKITNVHQEYCPDAYGCCGWDVECICPVCKTKWVFSDCDY